jgi:hypothetical protein
MSRSHIAAGRGICHAWPVVRAPLEALLISAVIAVTLLGAGPMRCEAQTQERTPAPTPSATPASGLSVSAGYEAHRDRLRYEFENASSFDTRFLVPHRFVQTYVADNQWFALSARYPLFGDVMETEFGLTPQRTTFASDLDTFFDPNGDVIVAGTAGDVSMHSLRFAHWSEATMFGLAWHAGYVYRRDASEFHSSERLVTHSDPQSESRTPISTHETTISQVHEVPIGVSKQIAARARWLLTGGADISPITVAKLMTILPEKYPGQEIVFQAKVAALTTRMQLAWRRERWPLIFTLNYGHTWSYQSSNQFSRDALQGAVRLGLRP